MSQVPYRLRCAARLAEVRYRYRTFTVARAGELTFVKSSGLAVSYDRTQCHSIPLTFSC